MPKINYKREVWEGWKVQDFIDELQPIADIIMPGGSWKKPFQNKKELAQWCKDNQSYYRNEIPEVVNYFAARYGIA